MTYPKKGELPIFQSETYAVCLDCNKRVSNDGIHTCSPQVKQKPVAWMTDDGKIVSNREKETYDITFGDYCIPLKCYPCNQDCEQGRTRPLRNLAETIGNKPTNYAKLKEDFE